MQQLAVAWVVGRVAAPPELSGKDQSYRTRVRVLNNRGYRSRETGEWVDQGPNGTEVICWGELARNVACSIQTGDPVVVYGRLEDSGWIDKDGVNHRSSRLVADVVAHDLTWGRTRFSKTNQAASQSATSDGGSTESTEESGESTGESAASAGVGADGAANQPGAGDPVPDPWAPSESAGPSTGTAAEPVELASTGRSKSKAKEKEPVPF